MCKRAFDRMSPDALNRGGGSAAGTIAAPKEARDAPTAPDFSRPSPRTCHRTDRRGDRRHSADWWRLADGARRVGRYSLGGGGVPAGGHAVEGGRDRLEERGGERVGVRQSRSLRAP